MSETRAPARAGDNRPTPRAVRPAGLKENALSVGGSVTSCVLASIAVLPATVIVKPAGMIFTVELDSVRVIVVNI